MGNQVYLVHDAFEAAGVSIQAFNAAHLRMIAASRKKCDRRDAYWIARSLQTKMTPHAVFIPSGEARELRVLLNQRRCVQRDRNRWQYRARAMLRAHGHRTRVGGYYLRKRVAELLEHPDGIDATLFASLDLCERYITMLGEELAHLDAKLMRRTEDNEAIERLQTVLVWRDFRLHRILGCGLRTGRRHGMGVSGVLGRDMSDSAAFRRRRRDRSDGD